MVYNADEERQESEDVKRVIRRLARGEPLYSIVPLCAVRKIFKKSMPMVLGSILLWCAASVVVVIGWDHEHYSFLVGTGSWFWLAWFMYLIALLAASCAYQFLYWLTYFYDLDKTTVRIRKGVVAWEEVTLPFPKIMDVYVDQDVKDAFLGLYDVHISTPTAQSGALAHIDGVNRAGSILLREVILAHVNQKLPKMPETRETAEESKPREDVFQQPKPSEGSELAEPKAEEPSGKPPPTAPDGSVVML